MVCKIPVAVIICHVIGFLLTMVSESYSHGPRTQVIQLMSHKVIVKWEKNMIIAMEVMITYLFNLAFTPALVLLLVLFQFKYHELKHKKKSVD